MSTSVLHMKPGNIETSYSNNSFLPRKIILMTEPLRTKAISELYCNLSPKTICIAELGCSSGPNAFLVSSEIVCTIYNISTKLGIQSPEVEVFLNDLPGNDFNNLFMLLEQFQEDKKHEKDLDFPHCYHMGVPGSFYGRLFPKGRLHFVHSSTSLHWLSQVPEGLESNNKGNIYIESTSSKNVVKAYYNQFNNDFVMFLKHRSIELINGGRMVLTLLGRDEQFEDPRQDCFLIFQLLAEALRDMVSEGLVEEEKLHSFNIPSYMPTPSEIETIVKEEGSFIIDHIHTFEVHWNEHINGSSNKSGVSELINVGFSLMKAIRSVLEPMLLNHQFHEWILDEMFKRYQNKITNCMSTGKKTVYFNIVVSMRKKENLIN